MQIRINKRVRKKVNIHQQKMEKKYEIVNIGKKENVGRMKRCKTKIEKEKKKLDTRKMRE